MAAGAAARTQGARKPPRQRRSSAVTSPDDITRPLLERTLREWRWHVSLRALLGGLALALTAASTLVLLDQVVALPVVVRATMRLLPVLILVSGSYRALSRV